MSLPWRPLLLALALSGPACSTLVAPRTILAEDELSLEQKEDYLAQWEAGIARANAFLASAENHSLPAGHYELANDGMLLRTEQGDYEVTVRKTTWGGLCATFGFPAQERSWGFVVGGAGEGPAAVGNSFFYTLYGSRRSANQLAELILHETAHQVYRVGTLDFGRSLRYYWLSLFHGYDGHPDEAEPYRVSQEFRAFAHPAQRAPATP